MAAAQTTRPRPPSSFGSMLSSGGGLGCCANTPPFGAIFERHASPCTTSASAAPATGRSERLPPACTRPRWIVRPFGRARRRRLDGSRPVTSGSKHVATGMYSHPPRPRAYPAKRSRKLCARVPTTAARTQLDPHPEAPDRQLKVEPRQRVVRFAIRQHAAGTTRVHETEHARSHADISDTERLSDLQEMVRRRSTVRVRQRASRSSC